jgi:glutaredoxin
MGRITIFMQPSCKYCDKVKAVIQAGIERHRDELAAVKPQYGIDVREISQPVVYQTWDVSHSQTN